MKKGSTNAHKHEKSKTFRRINLIWKSLSYSYLLVIHDQDRLESTMVDSTLHPFFLSSVHYEDTICTVMLDNMQYQVLFKLTYY